jgi:hypothetical protein
VRHQPDLTDGWINRIKEPLTARRRSLAGTLKAMTGGTGSGRTMYLARPNRPVLVADSLDELTGPEHGVVELPQRLMWNPNRRFDLDDPDLLLWMYENVLREAIRRNEFRQWINGRVLVRVWRKLNLPRPVRQAWEARHAQLRTAA